MRRWMLETTPGEGYDEGGDIGEGLSNQPEDSDDDSSNE